MLFVFTCWLLQLLVFVSGSTYKLNNPKDSYTVAYESPRESATSQNLEIAERLLQCTSNSSNASCNNQPNVKTENNVNRVRRKVQMGRSKSALGFHISGVFWDDVWKSRNIKWVAKMMDNNEIRPSDRQFFHTLIPQTLFSLGSTCINLDQEDERDYTLLAKISWKDRQPSLRYPPVPEQCAFGRSSGFLCVLLDDGDSCYYVSGWGQDRVQALVDGRRSTCGPRQQLHMMLHALGLMHEHDRGDALRFVSLHPRLRTLARVDDPLGYRIPQDDCTLFRQKTSSLPFDFASMMLHDSSFRPDSAQMDFELPLVPTRASDVRKLLASRGPGLSHFDQFKLRHLYGCQLKNCPQTRPCENFGFRNKLCQCECAPGYAGKYCENFMKPSKDHCLQTVKHSSNFTPNSTGCHPTNDQPFNYTIELTGKEHDRFVVTVDMTPVRAVLESLRILPTCEHARLYFTGTGSARPQVVCAGRLLLTPVTLRTRYSSGLLVLLIQLPSPLPDGVGRPDPAAAIGAVRLDVTTEPNPASELTVDTSRPPPASSTPAPESASEPSSEPAAEPTPPAPPSNPAPEGTTTSMSHLGMMPKLDNSSDSGQAQRAAGSSAKTGGIIVAVILLVLVATVALASYMLRYRRNDEDLEFEELGAANTAGEEAAAPWADEHKQESQQADGAAQAEAPGDSQEDKS